MNYTLIIRYGKVFIKYGIGILFFLSGFMKIISLQEFTSIIQLYVPVSDVWLWTAAVTICVSEIALAVVLVICQKCRVVETYYLHNSRILKNCGAKNNNRIRDDSENLSQSISEIMDIEKSRFRNPFISLTSLIIFIPFSLLSQKSNDYYTPPGIAERISSRSNIVFPVYNDGSIFYNFRYQHWSGWWPKDKDLISIRGHGLLFACKKENKLLVSSAFSSRRIGQYGYNQFVPGMIGDPKASADTASGGVGWKFVEDPNYIPYASTDYDANGVDISGYNYPDWPIRMVGGRETYVHNVLDRSAYPPVVKSDEDIFCVFKDTETKADPLFGRAKNPDDTMSVPIGIEGRYYCYSFGGPLKNVMIIMCEVINKSGKNLDSCFLGFEMNIIAIKNNNLRSADTSVYEYYSREPARNLGLVYNQKPQYRDPAKQSFTGIDVLSSPNGHGMTFWKNSTEFTRNGAMAYDTTIYNVIRELPAFVSKTISIFPTPLGEKQNWTKMFGSGPFHMNAGDTAYFSVGLMFAWHLKELLMLDDIVQTVFDKGIVKPQAPDVPVMTVTSTASGTLLQWDTKADHSIDPVIPDSIGKSFMGYRLYRAPSAKGPFTVLREWKAGRDSIVHSYCDSLGDDGRPLLSNMQYFYKLTAFDEGVPILEMEEMESAGNIVSIIHSAPPSSPYDLDNIRVVPNPFIVTHAAQASIDRPKLFFNYLPEECTIRIYTTALELVAEIHHNGGSREEWNLQTQGGQQVGSQLLIARIQTKQGTSVTKKFAVVAAE